MILGFPSSLMTFHRQFDDSVRWRLGEKGIEVEREGIPRSAGQPVTIEYIFANYWSSIATASIIYAVPQQLIAACIATESSGKAKALRIEPGWVSDEETPHRMSAGLMQTLLSTARGSLKQDNLTREDLFDPYVSIMAGTAYIDRQRKSTQLDPVLVAAAYNAGGLYRQDGKRNKFKLRCYPIGTSAHIERFIKFFNDAVAVWESRAFQ